MSPSLHLESANAHNGQSEKQVLVSGSRFILRACCELLQTHLPANRFGPQTSLARSLFTSLGSSRNPINLREPHNVHESARLGQRLSPLGRELLALLFSSSAASSYLCALGKPTRWMINFTFSAATFLHVHILELPDSLQAQTRLEWSIRAEESF